MKRLYIVACLVLITACGDPYAGPKPEEFVSPLVKLTPAVQAIVMFPLNGAPVSDSELLRAAMSESPELQATFARVDVRVRHDTENVVMLICSPDGKVGWIEDASWTPRIDHKWYETEPNHPAEFSMSPEMATR